MQVMGTELRKISLREGVIAALLSFAFTGGWAMALTSFGRDPSQALNLFVPVFIGSLISVAGINPVKSPQLVALVGLGAAGLMTAVKWATPLLTGVA